MATITIGVMDPPYESANTPTAFRLVDAALRKGHNVNVFCYEGATALGFAGQKQHPNPVHGATLEAEDHPNPKEWVKSLLALHKDSIRTVGSDADVIDAVASTPGAIGFVEERSITDRVSVVKVDGKLPMESGYLPH